MSLEAILSSMTEGAGVLREFFIALCSYALGWYLVGMAGAKMLNWNDPRRTYGWNSVAARFIVGTCFIHASEYINMQVLTWTGYGLPADNAMSVMPASGSSVPMMIMQTVMAWVATLGVIAIIKGTRLIVKAADGSGQPASMHEDPGWTAGVYIVAGSFGVNLWRWVSPYI